MRKSVILVPLFLSICIFVLAEEEVLTVNGIEKLKIDEIVSDD